MPFVMPFAMSILGFFPYSSTSVFSTFSKLCVIHASLTNEAFLESDALTARFKLLGLLPIPRQPLVCILSP